MACILYYSTFCEHSKKLLGSIKNYNVGQEFHFICIDKRIEEPDGKTSIILENGQKITMSPNVTKVPALLLLNQNFKVLYGDDIYRHLTPIKEKPSAHVNTVVDYGEPAAFSLGGGSSIASDQYSFLDQGADELTTKGDGGLRQMHNYVTLSHNDMISTPDENTNFKNEKIPEEMTIAKLQQMRDQEMTSYKK